MAPLTITIVFIALALSLSNTVTDTVSMAFKAFDVSRQIDEVHAQTRVAVAPAERNTAVLRLLFVH